MSQNRGPMRVTGLFLAMMLESVRIVSEHDKTSTSKRRIPQPHPGTGSPDGGGIHPISFPEKKSIYEDGEVETDGAGDRDRTGDIQLGKLAFYR